jgi:hypothetical protein
MASTEALLTSDQQRYMDWLCTAPSERVPSSKKQYAILASVDVTTLRRWEKKPAFRQEWQTRVDDLQGSPERTQALLDTLYNKALEGDTKSAQLYLQATNRMTPTTIEVKSEKRSAELSDSELDELIAAMASREKQSRGLRVV